MSYGIGSIHASQTQKVALRNYSAMVARSVEKILNISPLFVVKILIVALVGATVMFFLPRLVRSATPSLKYTVFFKGFTHEVSKGAYISFMSTYRNKSEHYIKQVTCVEGDRLVEILGDYFCNNDYLGKALDHDNNGPIKRFQFKGQVPPGMLFVSDTHPLSYDSRYFGFIKKEDVLAVDYPIF